MKKIYTLAALAVSAMAANAAVSDLSANRVLDVNDAVEVASKNTVKTVATRADEGWTSLGEGKYRESIFSSMYEFVEVQDIPVEIEQSTVDPNKYRVVNPYANWDNPFRDVTYDVTGTYYIYFSKLDVNGKTYWYLDADDMPIGIIYPDINIGGGVESGMISIVPMLGPSLALHPDDYMAAFGERAFGKYEDDVFTYAYNFDDPQSGKSYVNMLFHFETQEEGYGFTFPNANNAFAIALPGANFEGYDPFSGMTLIGECDFYNPLLENLFNENMPSVRKVNVYKNPQYNGGIAVQNAWGEWNTADQKIVFDVFGQYTDCMFLNWQEVGYNEPGYGDIGVLSTSYLYCYTYNDNRPSISVEEFMSQYPNEVFGINNDRRLTIPAEVVLYECPDAGEGFFQLNKSQATWIENAWLQLPADYPLKESAVKEISVDGFDANAPVEYFNIQGMRINNPAEGQLVIMKQGNKAVKVIVK